MTTSRQIAKAIQLRTGFKGVKVSKAQGMCRFYCDGDEDIKQGFDLSLTDAEYVPRLNLYTPDEWADIFEDTVKSCLINKEVN